MASGNETSICDTQRSNARQFLLFLITFVPSLSFCKSEAGGSHIFQSLRFDIIKEYLSSFSRSKYIDISLLDRSLDAYSCRVIEGSRSEKK